MEQGAWSKERHDDGGKPMVKKVFGLALSLLCALLFALSFPAQAQQAKKIPRIGLLFPGSQSAFAHWAEDFRQGLRELGYKDGQNISIEERYADEKVDRVAMLAAELIELKVNVLVVTGTQSVQTAMRATMTIPIVFPMTPDPVQSGFVASLAWPGRNATGLVNQSPELSGKRLELLMEAVSKVSRVAVMVNPTNFGSQLELKEMRVAAQALGVQLRLIEVTDPKTLNQAFAAMARYNVQALTLLGDAIFHANRSPIAQLAARSRLPTMYPQSDFVTAGGLMSYGTNFSDLFRRAATYVDKILKGSNPAELPVERPKKFDLEINLKAVKQIGLIIPPNVLARADRVIR
jgi:putative ABC transport system substrate-binding protein